MPRLARQLEQIVTAYQLAHANAVRQCVRLGMTPSEAEMYLLRSTASTATITAPATTTPS